MNIEICTCCPKDCTKENLHCPRGKQHFGIIFDANNNFHQQNHKNMSLDDKVITLMKICGHHLHHKENLDHEELLSCLNTNEKKQLFSLLMQCVESWNY